MELASHPVSAIKTTRILSNGRVRLRDPKDLGPLKESIKQFGQLIPIIIERDLELVDGMRRLTAFRELGIPEIAAVYQDQLDDLTARTLELEANIERLDMTWQERIFAIAELQKLRQAADPNWSQDQTAQLAGPSVTQSRVSEAMSLSKMIQLFPEIGKAKSINQAQSWAKAKAASIVRVVAVKNEPEVYASIEDKIILGDSRQVIKDMPDGSFNMILTDPPFGIDYDGRMSGKIGSLSSYQDDEANYLTLLAMGPDLYRVLKPDGWLVWFLGHSWYERAKLVFRESGFIVDEIPIVWDRSDGRSFTSRPDRYFGRGYDIALHCIKGDPQIIQRGKSNIIRVPPLESSEKDLLVERPVELYAEIIRRLTVPGESVVDFFTGSGSVLAAAAMTGRQYLGVELDIERRAVAIRKVKAHTPS